MLGELLELADDEPLMAECHADLRALAVRIGAMHRRVPSDNAEREAILTIEAEPGEAENWTYILWRMYVEQAERDGRRVRIHNRYGRVRPAVGDDVDRWSRCLRMADW
jgi:hypothetical protein